MHTQCCKALPSIVRSALFLLFVLVTLLPPGTRTALAFDATPDGPAFSSLSPSVTPSNARLSQSLLSQMLDADGTLNLPPNFSGSLDVTGWKLVSGAGEPPRFAPLKNEAADRLTPPDAPRIAGDENWAAGFDPMGVNGVVNAIAVDGSGNVYVGGQFNAVAGTLAGNIAKWNGTAWSGLGNGLYGTVYALAWLGLSYNVLYVGGTFTYTCADVTCGGASSTRLNHVASWKPATSTWSALANGVDNNVLAIGVTAGGNTYFGGDLHGYCNAVNCSTTTTANHIAKWLPGSATWEALVIGGSNGTNDVVRAIVADNITTYVYFGGDFTTAVGISASRIARWFAGGPTIATMNFGVPGPVRALTLDTSAAYPNQLLYVGGDFDYVCNDALCVGHTPVNHVVRWNIATSNWTALNFGVNDIVRGLALDASNNLYAAGTFTNLCANATCGLGASASRIAKWDKVGSSWSSLGSGFETDAYAVRVSGSDVYAGGQFSVAGGAAATGVAKWNGSWSALGSGKGLSKLGYSVVSDRQGNVYVGGRFKTAGGVIVNNIARWNAASGTWSPLGYGLMGAVRALAIDGNGYLYASGEFTYTCADADCVTHGDLVIFFARWDPVAGTWSSLRYGALGEAMSFAIDRNNNVYAGGMIMGICANADCSTRTNAHNLIRWDGSSWSEVGHGVNGLVYSVMLDGNNNLDVGGSFTNVCADAAVPCTAGLKVNNIAKWNGTWSALGSGLNGPVTSLKLDSSNNLYAGGAFINACPDEACGPGGTLLYDIGKWNGAWSALGNGIAGPVWALAVDDADNVFAAGDFTVLCGAMPCTPGATVNSIAEWNGSAWSALGSGIVPLTSSTVSGLDVRNGTLTAVGTFSRAGDKISANFAQYRYTYTRRLRLPFLKR